MLIFMLGYCWHTIEYGMHISTAEGASADCPLNHFAHTSEQNTHSSTH